MNEPYSESKELRVSQEDNICQKFRKTDNTGQVVENRLVHKKEYANYRLPDSKRGMDKNLKSIEQRREISRSLNSNKGRGNSMDKNIQVRQSSMKKSVTFDAKQVQGKEEPLAEP